MIAFSVHMCGIGLKSPLIATLPGGKTSKSHQTHFSAIFAHNVNSPGKIGEFLKLFSARMVVFGIHMGGIELKFSLTAT